MSVKTNQKVKRLRCGALTSQQCQLFKDYLRTGQMPPDNLLSEAGLKDDPPRSKLGRYGRFRGWASRMTLGTEGTLLFSKSGKIILPKELYTRSIRSAHKQNNDTGTHLTFSATLVKLHEKYTMGRRQFGMSDELVRQVVYSCKEGPCSEKNKKMENSGENQCFRNILHDIPLDLTKKRNGKTTMHQQPESTVHQVNTVTTSQQLIPVQMSVIKATSKGLICSPVGQNTPTNPSYHLLYQDQQGKFQVTRFYSIVPPAPVVLAQAKTNVTSSTVKSATGSSSEIKSELCRHLCNEDDSVTPKVSKITATQIGIDDKVYTVGITPETQHTTTVTLAQTQNKKTADTSTSTSVQARNKPSLVTLPVQLQGVLKAIEQVLPTSTQTGCAKSFDVTFTIDNKGVLTKRADDNTEGRGAEHPSLESGVAMGDGSENCERKRKGNNANNSSISSKNSRKQSFKVRDFDESSFSELVSTSNNSKHGNSTKKVSLDQTSALANQLLKNSNQDVAPSFNQEEVLKMWSSLLEPGRVPYPGIWYDYHDLVAEDNCFRRLLGVIRNMRPDIMRCIVNDNMAYDRLKRKMAYAETLIRHYKNFIQRTQKVVTI
ncbi:hypothetical protein ScPMuIL_001377 [Solemya velum]